MENAVTSAVGVVVQRVVPNAIQLGANAASAKLQELIKQGPQAQAGGRRASGAARARAAHGQQRVAPPVAAWGLNEYGEDPVAVEALVNALRHDASEPVREMAAWSLSNSERSPGAVDALAAALRDGSVNVRKTAAWALGNVGDRRAVEPLVAALADANADVRSRAVWALGNVEPKEAPRQLVAMLSDKDARVRELTAWALYNIEDPSTAPALQAALRAEQDKDLQLALHPRARGDGREVRRRDPTAARVERPAREGDGGAGARRWSCHRSVAASLAAAPAVPLKSHHTRRA